MIEENMGQGWRIDKSVDISLISSVFISAVAAILATVKGWMYIHDRIRETEKVQALLGQEIRTIKESHERDLVVFVDQFKSFAERIEKAIDRLSDKLDQKADKN